MNNIKVILIDDEPKCIEMLESLLSYQQDVSILGTASDMISALPLIEKHKENLDILFLDIQMPGGDGFTLLQQIPQVSFKIIFTTAFDQYAIQAIRFSAIDYLLKPIDNIELVASLDRYRQNLPVKEPVARAEETFKNALVKKELFDKLAIPTPKDILFFHLNAITYMESDNNYTTVFFENGKSVVSSKNIGHYEELLENRSFFRIHNSYLVNLEKIIRFAKGKQAYVELEHNVTLEVSPKKRDMLLAYLQMR